MSYIIVGASSGLGKEIAYEFAKKEEDLILISRDSRDLSAIKSDLKNLYNTNVQTFELDIANMDSVEQFINDNEKDFKSINGIICTAGMINAEDGVDNDRKKIQSLLFTNFSSISFLISKLTDKINLTGKISVIGFGSVSGLLGRKHNTYYAASKRALNSFFESLSFSEKSENLNIQFYILGYLDTNLAFGKDLTLPKGSTRKLAIKVYKNRNDKFQIIYFPYMWFYIGLILKVIPFFLLRIISKIIK